MGFRDWFRFHSKARPDPGCLQCSFCGKSGADAEKLIAGPPPFFICDACVKMFSETGAQEEARRDQCSFCSKKRRQVRALVGGEKTSICDECLGLCRDILAEERASGRSR